ncbi:fibroblast growth factor receptor homolog 1-like [Ptychodera flava]|uniref:fibroblast growth factor receptor homolog 1-like n=1 Tax=Ptychodera flava TaxID=63121 RepID=UPI00396AA3AA
MYDEVTGQPPTSRSREAIHNTDGIVFFQIDYSMSSSCGAEPHNWRSISNAEIEIYIPPPDPESLYRNERLTVWLRAHDVIGHTANDSVVFYIDRTNPVITNVTFTEDSKRTPGVQRVIVNAHDVESGILEIRWKLFDRLNSALMYGEGTVNGISATVELNAEPPDNSVPVTAGESSAIFISVPAVAVVIVIVVVILVMHRRWKLTKGLRSLSRENIVYKGFEDDEHANHQRLGDVEEDRYQSLPDSRDTTYQSLDDVEDVKYESLMKADKPTTDSDGTVDSRCRPQVNSSNTNNGGPSLVNADRSMRTREQAEISSAELILTDLLKPGIHKASLSNMDTSGTFVVVAKCLKDSSSVVQKEHLLNELDVMLSITPHVNVIELLGCIISSGSPKPCIVLEFATHGSLKDLLRSIKDGESNVDKGTPSMSGDELLSFADQIACGMEHLATLKIIHRKLGIRNIFVGKGKICKIGCFSHAVKTDKEFEEIRDCQEGRLPLRWMAPESLEEGVFSLKTDVWTYGVMLWEIVTLGQTPYPGVTSREIAEYILKGRSMEKPAQCTGELYSLMLLCWALNPRNRPSMSVLRRELRFIIQNRCELDGTATNFKPYEDID